MPIYCYQHPVTQEIFEDLRAYSQIDDPFVALDGIICPRIIATQYGYMGLSENEREVYQVDRDYVKKCSPKKIRLRNGQKVKYDPTKHN